MASSPPVIPPTPNEGAFLKKKDIVIVSISDWEGPKRIRQFLSEELARQGNRVLFVESQYTLSKFIKKPNFSRLLLFFKGPRKLRENLFLLATIPFLPGGEYSSLISRINWNIQRTFLRAALKQLGFRSPILWTFAYNASGLIDKLDESLSIYFCNDAFHLLVQSKNLQQRVTMLERDLLQKVDVVFTVSDKLSKEKSEFHHPVHTVTHGVDFELFQRLTNDPAPPRPSDVPSGKPVIGYSGVVRYMLDLSLLRYLADNRPVWNFVLVGPVAESSSEFYSQIEDLKRRPNVYFLGSKRPEELPAYINTFDVCLLPYVQSEVSTYYAAPLKFFEYLAAGKPVVSTVGPAKYEQEVVLNGRTPEEILQASERALRETSSASVTKRKEIARENSWEHRVREIDRVLASLPKKPHQNV